MNKWQVHLWPCVLSDGAGNIHEFAVTDLDVGYQQLDNPCLKRRLNQVV